MSDVFVDTSAWYELADRQAPRHEAASAAIATQMGGLMTSTCVLAELTALVVARLRHEAAAVIGQNIRRSPDVEQIHPSAADEVEAWRLFLDRPDKTYSLTDYLSFILMRRHGIETALSTDQHFRQEGFRILP